jgi:hypothetical protein
VQEFDRSAVLLLLRMADAQATAIFGRHLFLLKSFLGEWPERITDVVMIASGRTERKYLTL